MKQILIKKNSQIRELSGSRINFYYKDERPVEGERGLSVGDRDICKVVIPFSAKIMSGGTLDLDFTLPEAVAARGVTLLGAYWDGQQVTAYLRSIVSLPQFIPDGEPILIGTLVQVTTMRQIESDILGDYELNESKSGDAIVIMDKAPAKKRQRRPRK